MNKLKYYFQSFIVYLYYKFCPEYNIWFGGGFQCCYFDNKKWVGIGWNCISNRKQHFIRIPEENAEELRTALNHLMHTSKLLKINGGRY